MTVTQCRFLADGRMGLAKPCFAIGPRSNGAKNRRRQNVSCKIELKMECGMLSRAEEYRQRAKDCEQMAQETFDAGMKALFQELGNQWLHLASEVELPNQKQNMQ